MFRFTLFNGITLFIFTLTVLMAVVRSRGRLKTNWSLPYYAVIALYSLAFDGSLSTWWVLAGVVCALTLRAGVAGRRAILAMQSIEFVFFGYVLLRSAQLVLMWPW